MVNARSAFLSLLAGATVALAAAPGCSNNGNVTAQTALDLTLDPSADGSGTCGVGPGVEVKVGAPLNVQTVGNGDSANGAAVTVECSVKGNDSAGYDVSAKATYGTLYTFFIQGHFDGPTNGTLPTETSLSAEIDSGGGGFIASLAQSTGCKVTFPEGPPQQTQGLAPTRVAGTISCPAVTDSKRGATCALSGSFLFENCSD